MVAWPLLSVVADLPAAVTVAPLTASGSLTVNLTAVVLPPLIFDGEAASSSPGRTRVCHWACLPEESPNSATMSRAPAWAFPSILNPDCWPFGGDSFTAGPNLVALLFERRAKTCGELERSIQKTQMR